MLTALLKGKLSSEQENMEDVLTSSVFGAFQYSESADALILFLKKSKPAYGNIPIKDDVDGLEVSFEDYDFWPQWNGLEGVNNCEPDLVIKIHNAAGQDVLVVIEAKFHSGKSAFPSVGGDISDQLAKQWVHLYRKAKKESCVPWLIYLTADTGTPKNEILEAKDELFNKPGFSSEAEQLRISWLSWCELAGLFKHSSRQQLSDLSSLATYLGLVYYKGMGRLDPLPGFHYRFRADSRMFDWNFDQPLSSDWEFRNDQ
jgi:hypothetical protein